MWKERQLQWKSWKKGKELLRQENSEDMDWQIRIVKVLLSIQGKINSQFKELLLMNGYVDILAARMTWKLSAQYV